jgi:hypothetical protein
MNISPSEFLCICELSTKEIEPVYMVNNKSNDEKCGSKSKEILISICGQTDFPDFDPMRKWV